ncbi:HDOD domain-containing protein [Massilia sp. IC2-477]|uniref:HDOD domain-containing protein n=1 Tax=unclassified Massilia TaxID=2609279 RepID=UPI001D0FB046|nr:HDOD domain-containing protein [Massilia sp. IC2-477]MCC2970963.1 HDOD domain-containing protein [Massilia sp. IC2-476]
MNKLEAFGYIAAQAARGDITFPTSVNAVLRLQLALDDPDCHVDEAIRLVLSEPQLAARTVALANTAAYGSGAGGMQVTNVRAAVLRIGYRRLRGLVAALMVRQFGHRIADPILRAKAEQLWTHSAQVAALAHSVARHVTRVDPDTALFAGIVHEVGGFYLLSRADEFPGLLEDDTDRWGVLVEDVAGAEIMRKLDIPADVAEAIGALRDGVLQPEPHTLLDTLLLANRYALVDSPLGAPRLDDHEAGPLDAATLQLLRSEAAETAQALGDASLV